MTRKPKPPNPRRDAARRSPRLSGVTVPRELMDAVRARAFDRDITVSAAVAEALRDWIGGTR